MPEVTLEAIEAKQTELSKLIEQFKEAANKPTLYVVAEMYIKLFPGERYAGFVLDEAGHIKHHLVLMAQRPDSKLNWKDATTWANSFGGVLPTRQELSMLFTNCKPHVKPEWHWSSEEHADDASYAWYCFFTYGFINGGRKSYEGSAVAVRRV